MPVLHCQITGIQLRSCQQADGRVSCGFVVLENIVSLSWKQSCTLSSFANCSLTILLHLCFLCFLSKFQSDFSSLSQLARGWKEGWELGHPTCLWGPSRGTVLRLHEAWQQELNAGICSSCSTRCACLQGLELAWDWDGESNGPCSREHFVELWSSQVALLKSHKFPYSCNLFSLVNSSALRVRGSCSTITAETGTSPVWEQRVPQASRAGK